MAMAIFKWWVGDGWVGDGWMVGLTLKSPAPAKGHQVYRLAHMHGHT